MEQRTRPYGACDEPFDSAPQVCRVCRMSPRVAGLQRCSKLVAESPAMQELLVRAAPIARSDAPVVVLGESGTGKDVLARALHANSARHGKPFVAVNVAALPGDLLESELFGHAKGAFTGAHGAKTGLLEAAHGGTIFLDEIGEMPLAMQAKLLRALQDGEVRRVGETRAFAVDARILCATNRDLASLVERGRFREDLYYRLHVFKLTVPPLRDRVEDILPLATTFLAELGHTSGRFTSAARRALEAYDWPGNVRELSNAVRHGAVLAGDEDIAPPHLPDEVRGGSSPGGRARKRTVSMRPLADVEREHVLGVLEACGGNRTEAARVLGIGRNSLWRKLRTFGFDAPG